MAEAAAAPTTTYREALDSIRSAQLDDFAQRKERLLSEFGIEARPAEDIQSVEGLLRELEERLELEDSGGDEALDDPRQRGNLLTLVRLVPLLGLDLHLPAVPQPDPDAAALAAAPLGGGEGGGEIVLHPNHRMLIACVRRNFESRNKKLNLKKRKKKAIFICGAADRSGRGKRCSSCCCYCCCWGGPFFSFPCTVFWGVKRQNFVSKGV